MQLASFYTPWKHQETSGFNNERENTLKFLSNRKG